MINSNACVNMSCGSKDLGNSLRLGEAYRASGNDWTKLPASLTRSPTSTSEERSELAINSPSANLTRLPDLSNPLDPILADDTFDDYTFSHDHEDAQKTAPPILRYNFAEHTTTTSFRSSCWGVLDPPSRFPTMRGAMASDKPHSQETQHRNQSSVIYFYKIMGFGILAAIAAMAYPAAKWYYSSEKAAGAHQPGLDEFLQFLPLCDTAWVPIVDSAPTPIPDLGRNLSILWETEQLFNTTTQIELFTDLVVDTDRSVRDIIHQLDSPMFCQVRRYARERTVDPRIKRAGRKVINTMRQKAIAASIDVDNVLTRQQEMAKIYKGIQTVIIEKIRAARPSKVENKAARKQLIVQMWWDSMVKKLQKRRLVAEQELFPQLQAIDKALAVLDTGKESAEKCRIFLWTIRIEGEHVRDSIFEEM